MDRLDLGNKLLDDLYKVKTFDSNALESEGKIGQITEKEKFKAAKQILLGLAILYVITLSAYMIRPVAGNKLLDIMMVTFPPLATLILAAYFRDRPH